ncbi:MAG: recombinase family protein [Lachnospiraceae bacterium]
MEEVENKAVEDKSVIKKTKRIGIYARKSKFTGKGNSIGNQVKSCKEYIKNHLINGEDEEILTVEIYEDEGISGKDIVSRPAMVRLISDVEHGKIQIIICYRLDRISRSVKDFSELVAKFTGYGVGFISVNEAFDTRTPMGRAMMYIASVFAQLERETIAERITDNMYSLAKKGHWLGGRTPLGFKSIKIEETDSTGRKRSRYCLETIEEEAGIVKILYYKYLELGSLTKLETYLMNNNYYTRSGKMYGRYTLKAILSNPVYCMAGKSVYKYLVEKGYGVYSEPGMFDGKRGLIAYNKNNCKAGGQRINNAKDWIIAAGEHSGIIEPEVWIKTQEIIKNNSGKSYRYPKTTGALLSGIVRCGKCGSFMRPKGGRKTVDGEKKYYYQCECKEKSRGNLCQMPNISGNILDKMVVSEILGLKERIITEYGYLQEVIEKARKNTDKKYEKDIIQKQIKEYGRQAESLIDALGKSRNENTTELILKKIDEITDIKNKLQKQYNEKQNKNIYNTDNFSYEAFALNIIHLKEETWKLIKPARQKDIIKMVVREIVWDGENAVIYPKCCQ